MNWKKIEKFYWLALGTLWHLDLILVYEISKSLLLSFRFNKPRYKKETCNLNLSQPILEEIERWMI